MKRVSFFIDGFNLYHSIKQAEKELKQNLRWLDIQALCNSTLSAIRQSVGERVKMNDIHYFTAYAHHLYKQALGIVQRHRTYTRCLRATGIKVHEHRFKKSDVFCRNCHQFTRRYEEKETEVAIACTMLEALAEDNCDVSVIVSGDTDLAPAVRSAMKLFPDKDVLFAFPFKRHNAELKALQPHSIIFSKSSYQVHQLANPYLYRKGRKILKPIEWE